MRHLRRRQISGVTGFWTSPPPGARGGPLATLAASALAASAALATLSCSSSDDGLTGLSRTSGVVNVSVGTTGSDIPAGYVVLLDDDAPRSIDANGSVSFSSVTTGDHSVALDDVPSSCVVAGPNPTPVTVTRGQTVEVEFSVSCGPTDGTIDVRTSTFGTNIDADGYTVALEGAAAPPAGSGGSDGTIETVDIGTDDAATFPGVAVGDYRLRLTDVAPNCGIRGIHPVEAIVTADAVAVVRFTVDCHAEAGALELSTVTAGIDLDPDGYIAIVDDDDLHPIGPNDAIVIGGLSIGDHTVRLSGVVEHCTVADPETVEFTVTADETTGLTVTIECGESANSLPSVTISAPDTSRTAVPLTVAPGAPVTFTGAASDPEDGPLTESALAWRSNVDGALGSGESITVSSLSEGLHTVTLAATDGDAGVGTESALVVVVAPPGPGYQIKLRLAEGLELGPAERSEIEAVLDQLESVVVGDVPDLPFATSAFACGAGIPPINETIDDLLLYLAVERIDGPGGVLGAASACIQRDESEQPALGGMVFDSADLPEMISAGLLDELVLHETMHVMGFGTIWNRLGLLKDSSDPNRGGTPGNDTYFDGAEAIAQFLAVGGDEYTGGNIVPVENDTENLSSGSLDSHWRESVFGHEIMTPVLDRAVPVNPLSVVTIGQFQDLGYTVDPGAADPYERDFSALALQAPDPAPADRRFHLEDDIIHGPLWVVSPDGSKRRVR